MIRRCSYCSAKLFMTRWRRSSSIWTPSEYAFAYLDAVYVVSSSYGTTWLCPPGRNLGSPSRTNLSRHCCLRRAGCPETRVGASRHSWCPKFRSSPQHRPISIETCDSLGVAMSTTKGLIGSSIVCGQNSKLPTRNSERLDGTDTSERNNCQRGSVVVILGVVHFTRKHRDPTVGLRMLEQLTLRQPILWCVVVGEVNSSFARLQTPVAESAPRVQTFPTELAARTSLLVGSGNQLLPLWQP